MSPRPAVAMASSLLLTLALCAEAAAAEFPFEMESVASFDEPWALAFLPDGRLLVTEKKGILRIVTPSGDISRPVPGVPDVAYGGQGGLGDVALHPDFEDNGLVYLSYAEAGVGGTRGAAVARGRLVLDARGRGALEDVEVIWRQYPKVLGYGHYGHRLLFDGDGYLWISSGDRQKFTPSQDMQANLGKVLRLHDDGSVPEDNPFVDLYDENPLLDDAGIYPEVFSLGPSQSPRPRPRPRRAPLGTRDGSGRWRRAESRAPRRQLRLSARLQRRSLRRPRDPRSRHAPRSSRLPPPSGCRPSRPVT